MYNAEQNKTMSLLKTIANGFVDKTFLAWFSPKWRKLGREAADSLQRFINTYRHKLKPEELAECSTMLRDIRTALLHWNAEETDRLTKLISLHCEPLPGFKRNEVLEMVESFFVIMVVFLGIRTYYAQPFRIPTGSMQPTLNGIIVHHVDEIPSAPKRWWDTLTLGSSYVEAVSDSNKTLVGIEDHPKWLLFTETVLTFDDGSTVTLPSAKGAVIQYLQESGKIRQTPSGALKLGSFRQGETIIRARVDAGDMVIVNRFAYHFRQPQRGETFVFDTRGINTSMQAPGAGQIEDQMAGTHYIKRLCGVPGDTLFIDTPTLFVNGEPAKEHGMQRVMDRKAPYNPVGYQQLPKSRNPLAFLTDAGPVQLHDNADPNLREYMALGDNTVKSLDSRFWGPVHQYNVLGPAWFTLWPFTSHWGSVD